MYKVVRNLAFVALVVGLSVFSLNAQNTKVIANADGSYTVIQYPVDKDVDVMLTPYTGITSHGMAHVLRTANGTKVVFDINGAPSDWKEVYAYAVDPSGASTYLGPVTFTEGVGKAEFMTPNDKFMLVLSPSEGLTTYDTSTKYYFRSAVPAGYAIVPRSKIGIRPTAVIATDAPVAGVAASVVTASTYDVPMLGMAKYKGNTTKLELKFGGELSGLQAHAYLKPVGGKTQIRMTFDDLQKAPMNKRFVLWTSGPEGYTKIGQVIHAGKKDTAEIKGETALSDFGLFLTAEDIDVDRPTSTIYSTFTVMP